MSGSGEKAFISALPMPLAQAWRRTLYSVEPGLRHDRALGALEAALKYLAAAAAAAFVHRGASEEKARSACGALVRPSLGQWLAILRACLEALPREDGVRRHVEAVLSQPLTSSVPGLEVRSVGAALEKLPTYRNALAHGTALTADSVAERTPGLLELCRAVLAAHVREGAPAMWARIEAGTIRLGGPTAILESPPPDAPKAPGVFLAFESESIALSPLWTFDPEEDDVLVLNKGAGLAKVEYLSYGAPRGGSGLAVFKGAIAEAMRAFLEKATGRSKIESSDVAELVEQSEAQELLGRASQKRIGPYRIVKRISEGGQGILYEAIQEEPPRRVALKTLPVHAAIDEASRRRIREEAKALATVEHPHVVPVYAAGESDGIPWIAMKYVEGKSLAQALNGLRGHAGAVTLAEWNRAASSREDRPDEERRQPHSRRVAEMGRDLARALSACHERGLVHRDVKPGNVMLEGDTGRVLLTDFGLARTAEARSQTFTRKIVGTLQYLAPESLLSAGRTGPDARVDVYGLGATLYEALSLQRPFAEYEADEPSLLQAVQAKDPPALRKVAPWVPRDLETIVSKAMEKDRDRRYRAVWEFGDDLDRYLEGKPIHARPAGAITKALKWSRRHPGRAVALAMFALLVAAGGTAWAVVEAARHRAVARHLREGEAALEQGEWRAALAAGEKAWAIKPDDAAVRELRSRAERASALDGASTARAEAAEKERQYVEARAALEPRRAEAAALREECFTKYAPTAKRAALNRLETEISAEEARLERLAAEGREALERATRFEAPHFDGGPSPETKAAFASYFLGRWKEAFEAKDPARERLFREDVERFDEEKRHEPALLGRGTLTVTVEPVDAELYLFRYEPYETVRLAPPVVSRLVPVPTSGIGRSRPGAWVEDFFPGDLCLVITKVEPDSPAEKAGLRRGDLVIRIHGQPCGDGLFVTSVAEDGLAAKAGVKALDRIDSIEGEPVEGEWEWRYFEAQKPDGEAPLTVVIAGKAFEAERGTKLDDALGLKHASPADVVGDPAPAGGLSLTVLRSGDPKTLAVPEGEACGLTCEVTAYPFVLSPANRITAGGPFQADPGSYLLLARREGFEDQRYPVVLPRGSAAAARMTLLEEGTSPSGFVYVPPGPFIYGGDPEAFGSGPRQEKELLGFFIARLEATTGEWMAFVNEAETLKKIEEGKGPAGMFLPRDGGQIYARKGEDGKYAVTYGGTAETPILGISWNDIQGYLEWRNQKAEASGEKWRYELSKEEEWEKAARGADGRLFPWGDRFDFSMCVGGNRKKDWLHAERGGFEPRDESVFGVVDVGGSRYEWTCSEWAPGSGTYSVRGGAWGSTLDPSFRCANRYGHSPTAVNSRHGFRLVARVRP
jgi:serine/threonine protein kinase/formylglycine-generating enzyme required for sulfatase activity